jgi:hypothetical protein
MHRPGYVQGGQEAKRGYLLLGVYHRRIPGDTKGNHTTQFILLLDYIYNLYVHILCVLTIQGETQVARPQEHLKSPSPIVSFSSVPPHFYIYLDLGVHCL